MAAAYAILLVVAFLRLQTFKPRTHLPILVVVLLWLAFGRIEQHAQQEGWNIRVDLLFTWPLLFAISVGAAWLGMRSIFTTNAKSQPDDDSQDPFPVDSQH